AQELHALVMRAVEQMNDDTRAAQRYLVSDASRAAQSMAAIEATGRDALVEMRRLLVVLRARSEATAPYVDGFQRSQQLTPLALDQPRIYEYSPADGTLRCPARSVA